MGGRAPEVRNRLGGLALLSVGAILLFVSLFLDWFEPGNSAWTIFEVWDIVLAALALAALAAAAGAFGVVGPRPDSWAIVPALVAPVVVIVSLINQPPAAQQIGQDPMVGVWLALAGSLLMLIGAALSVARISVAIDRAAPSVGSTPGHAPGPAAHPGSAPGAPGPGLGGRPGPGPEPGAPVGPDASTTPTRRVLP